MKDDIKNKVTHILIQLNVKVKISQKAELQVLANNNSNGNITELIGMFADGKEIKR